MDGLLTPSDLENRSKLRMRAKASYKDSYVFNLMTVAHPILIKLECTQAMDGQTDGWAEAS